MMWRRASQNWLSRPCPCVVVVCLLLATKLFALDPQKGITQFIHRKWSGEAGVSSVFSIVQTADGYIWLATSIGTLRFDGLRFTPLEQGPDEPPVIGYGYWLAGATDGSLWIGRTDNLIRVREGHSQVYGAKDGLPGAWVRTVCEGKDGVI